jgi:hypothetical protein
MSDAMRRLADLVDLHSVTPADLAPGADDVVAAGWVREPDGSVLARALRDTCVGSGFPDLTSREAAVNGRGVRDDDLPLDAPDRPQVLLRRAYSYATALLKRVAELPSPPEVTAFVTLGLSVTEPPYWESHVTFWSAHEGEAPYCDVDSLPWDDAVLVLRTKV